jgi:hypothetical protein
VTEIKAPLKNGPRSDLDEIEMIFKILKGTILERLNIKKSEFVFYATEIE